MSASKQPMMSHAKMIAVAAVCIAMAFMLNQVAIFRMPNGGSVTPASMLFIVLAGYWLGPVYGIMAGVALGFLDFVTGSYYVHPVQVGLDYILGFGILGISGFFRKQKFGLQTGYAAGVLGRFLMVFLSGFIFFGDYAPEGQHAIVYSAIYNASYITPEAIVTLIIISLPSMKHAIDIVTKSIVPTEIYNEIVARSRGSVSVAAKLVTGAIVSAFGGFWFVLAGRIIRDENLKITHFTSGLELFREPESRLYRMIERNTEEIFALQTAGIIFIVIGVVILFSCLIPKSE